MSTPEKPTSEYAEKISSQLRRINEEEHEAIRAAAGVLAAQIKADRLIHVYGPGGHSNLAPQEVFFRAGGLMHFSAVLDEGTLLNNGALRSMAIERTPGYGRVVIENCGLGEDDVLIIVNAYGINSATIDAAITAKERRVKTIGVTSVEHADSTMPDHPARHPSRRNLHEIVDLVIDSKVPIGDAVIEIAGIGQNIAAISTFCNAYIMNCLVIETVQCLAEQGITPPIWRSGNAPGGDEWNNQFISRFRSRVPNL